MANKWKNASLLRNSLSDFPMKTKEMLDQPLARFSICWALFTSVTESMEFRSVPSTGPLRSQTVRLQPGDIRAKLFLGWRGIRSGPLRVQVAVRPCHLGRAAQKRLEEADHHGPPSPKKRFRRKDSSNAGESKKDAAARSGHRCPQSDTGQSVDDGRPRNKTLSGLFATSGRDETNFLRMRLYRASAIGVALEG